jgi:glycosyltransferase involved in cell wall biosynthesis
MISILLPVYNVEKYIKQSINSILRNSYKNLELLIINDGSTDNTEEIIKCFSDERIKYFKKSNSGLIETLNYGIKKCNNSIIMRMDGDDLIHSKKIENQLHFFKKSGSILVGTLGYLIDYNGVKTGKINLPLNHKGIVNSMLKVSSGFIHPSVMFYKDALLKVGGYNTNFKHAEDFDLFLKLSKIGKISNLNERLIYLRKHENNVSLLNAKDQISNTIISRDIYKSDFDNVSDDSIYMQTKQKVDKNYIKNLYIRNHSTIVKLENSLNSSFNLKLFFMKVFRKILKIII